MDIEKINTFIKEFITLRDKWAEDIKKDILYKSYVDDDNNPTYTLYGKDKYGNMRDLSISYNGNTFINSVGKISTLESFLNDYIIEFTDFKFNLDGINKED